MKELSNDRGIIRRRELVDDAIQRAGSGEDRSERGKSEGRTGIIRCGDTDSGCRKSLADAKEKIRSGRAQIEEAKNTLTQKQQELDQAKTQYADGVQQLQDGRAQYEAGKTAFEAGKQRQNRRYRRRSSSEQIQAGIDYLQ